jgi:hypothetical protein
MGVSDNLGLEQARRDPGAVFDSPEALRDRTDISRDQKLELLRRWAYDARELAAAEDEGMSGGEPSPLGRIEAILAEMAESGQGGG